MAQRKSRRSSRCKEPQALAPYWRRQHQSWLGSGLTQAEFCLEHDLSLPSFCWWRWKLKKEGEPVAARAAPVESSDSSLRLVPVRVVDSEVERRPLMPASPDDLASVFEVVLDSGTCIRVPGDFDADALGRLLRTLEAVRC